LGVIWGFNLINMINNLFGIRAFAPAAIPTQLGTAFGFSIVSSTTSTFAGATTSANKKVGGLTATAVLLGTEQHYGNATSAQAILDVTAAYNYYKALVPIGRVYLGASATPTAASPVFAGDMAGLRFTPGIYFGGAAITNSTSVTFDAEGNANAQFVIQIGAAFAPAAASQVLLVNGAKASNVFWAVTGAVAIAAAAKFKGTILCLGAVGCAAGASIEGRILTTGAGTVTLSENVITTT